MVVGCGRAISSSRSACPSYFCAIHCNHVLGGILGVIPFAKRIYFVTNASIASKND